MPTPTTVWQHTLSRNAVRSNWGRRLCYAHLWKLKDCANADVGAYADADKRRYQRLGDNISSPGTWSRPAKKDKTPKNPRSEQRATIVHCTPQRKSSTWITKSIFLPVSVPRITGWVANSVDPDQTPRSAASDLGLHCLFRAACLNTQVKKGTCSLYHFELAFWFTVRHIRDNSVRVIDGITIWI